MTSINFLEAPITPPNEIIILRLINVRINFLAIVAIINLLPLLIRFGCKGGEKQFRWKDESEWILPRRDSQMVFRLM